MNLLRNASIGRRIAFAVVVPLLAAIGFGSDIVRESWEEAGAARQMASVAAAGPQFGAVVHELQTERGLTNTVLRNPQNRTAVEARAAQLSKVDLALGALRGAVTTAIAEMGEGAATAREALARIDELSALRQAVDARSIAPDAALARYTAIIDGFLAPVESLARHGRVGPTARAVVVYASVLRAKEAAGLERATGAGAFSPTGFARDRFQRFAELAAIQDSYLAVARRYGSADQARRIAELGQSPQSEAVTRLRALAARAALNGGEGMDPLEWFRVSTGRIDAMKGIEDAFSQDLTAVIATAAEEAHRRLTLVVGIVLAVTILAALAAWLAARSITRPLRSLTDHMQRLAEGDTSGEIEGGDRTNEIGAMVRAVQVFRDNAMARARLEQEAELERQRELQRQAALDEMIVAFRASVAEVIGTVDSEITGMRHTAAALERVAGQASGRAGEGRDASAASSTDVQAVSAAAEELISSISEISSRIHATSACIGRATEASRSTDAEVSGLAELAAKIGTIVDIIRSIAEQTNLLALNATIEAARAGEAGRGFAIVASEVKALASQTSSATDEIAAQIGAIQGATRTTVAAIRGIGGTVGEIGDLTTSIAAAVEEQTAATQEIAAAIARASDGSDAVLRAITDVTVVIGETNDEARRVAEVGELLSGATRRLIGSVDTFLSDIAKDVKDRRSAVRRRSTQAVLVFSDGRSITARLADISETGARVQGVPALPDGQRVTLRFLDGAEMGSQVVWTKDGAVGLQFDMPIGEAVVRRAA
ncbi:nitrate- and nitrite sensing domain-containing protein [Phreatobacter sp.]|uniref:methyl-accepting chemotaxis protein n=1 Tax=Phreatobacter sp. TaxID=1966341 RepID=UPI0022BD55DF|nr:nitrate- and nitrite sensing domain-containing protein [Phreatobacter sp.]MCZ8315575.1 nitrate- and nitrite sensing domain-containing protein [Phreatobacter sp.]